MARRYSKRRLGKRRRLFRGGRRRRGSRVARIVKSTLKRMAEIKYSYTTVQTSYDPYNGKAWNILPTIPQGTGIGQRNGNSIRTRRISFRGNFQVAPGGTAVPTGQYGFSIRLIIGRFKEQPPAYPTIATDDILDNSNLLSQIDNELFQKYYDKEYAVSGAAVGSYWGLPCYVKWKKSFKWNSLWNFKYGTTNSITDFDKTLAVFVFTNVPQQNYYLLGVNWAAKVSYMDL